MLSASTLKLIAILLLVLSVFIFFGAKILLYAEYYLVGLIVFIVASILLVFGKLIFNESRKLRLREEYKPVSRNEVPDVLYLRAFSDDKKTAEFGVGYFDMSTSEEALVTVLKKIGHVFTIGNPNDVLPEIGAKRVYVSDKQWKHRVTRYMKEAKLVVMRLGVSNGIRWEIEQAFKTVKPTHLVFLVPTSESYDEFCKNYSSFISSPLEEVNIEHHIEGGRFGALIYFKPEWIHQIVLIKGSSEFNMYKYAFRSVFKQLDKD